MPILTLDETSVLCTFPDGQTQTMEWDELRAVVIETTDEGPWMEDVYFLLFSDDSDNFCSIPQCAQGSQELLEKLMNIPGFNEEAVIKAMGCISNRSFLCWEQPGWVGENWPGIVDARE